MTKLRGIILLSALLKWYITCLVILADRPAPQTFGSVLSLGFEAGMACGQITGPLHILLAKSFEWPDSLPLTVFYGDVYQAFDHLRPSEVAASMNRRGMHPRLAAALLREGCEGLMEVLLFDNAPIGDDLCFNSCERTGSTDAPFKWKCLMADALKDAVPRWVEEELGVWIGNRRWTHLLWADNIYLLARGDRQAMHMAQIFTQHLERRRLYWKPSSLGMLSRTADITEEEWEDLPLAAAGSSRQHCLRAWDPDRHEHRDLVVPKVTETVQLGVKMNGFGDTNAAMRERIRLGQAAFFNDPYLRSTSLSRRGRMQRYRERVMPVLTDGADGWILNATSLKRLYQLEGGFLRKLTR